MGQDACKQPLIYCICGEKNSGKTTLVTELIPLLAQRGCLVATVKHDGHDFEPDVPGTDMTAMTLNRMCREPTASVTGRRGPMGQQSFRIIVFW